MISRNKFLPHLLLPVLLWLLVAHLCLPTSASVQHDATHKTVTLSDEAGLSLHLNYDHKCVLDEVKVYGRQVLGTVGTASGVQIGGQWFTTREGIESPKVSASKNSVQIRDITFGNAETKIRESWTFKVQGDRILWSIERTYPRELQLEESAFPQWRFASMDTWTGGILDNGGVVWNKYLERPNATYGAHAGAVTFWNRAKNDCLRITPTLGNNLTGAVRFSHQPQPTGDEQTFNYSVSPQDLAPKHELRRYLGDRQDLWAPFQVPTGTQRVEFSLQALKYDQAYDRGTFKGVEEGSIRELLNTVGRYGVIDTRHVGANGWRSGYICLHEQWFAMIGSALNDPNYNANFAATLNYWRDHAIKPDGRVLSRWLYNPGDAMPGTFTNLGFYEAQWGYLQDSQTDYVINVAEQFDLSGDTAWLAGQKQACEKALAYLLRREVNNSGLVVMQTDSRLQGKGSDWFDIVWASHENALVNAELYHALLLWADAEEMLGDINQATTYRDFAARLKNSFNLPTDKGGFWDSNNQWYIHWRDKDDSVHGNNLLTAVNFTAIAYGLCDDAARQKAVLDRIEAQMQKENLFHWPANFFSFERDEAAGSNFPFPSYENGDIFLSWGEMGVRAYASYDPALALKYVRKILDRYEQDGLSFQRYTRNAQSGAGDDILAGNCMAVIGLYRDIYGLQPKANRLYLEPHLTPELNGTQLLYQWRGRPYRINLNTQGSSITIDKVTVGAAQPFAINAAANTIDYFPAQSKIAQLSLTRPSRQQLTVQIHSWPTDPAFPRTWTQISPNGQGKIKYTLSGLRPDTRYSIESSSGLHSIRTSDPQGRIQFTATAQNSAPQQLTVAQAQRF